LGFDDDHVANNSDVMVRTETPNSGANLVESGPLVRVVRRRRRIQKEASVVNEVAVGAMSR
jgi:hypothetical protein